MKAMGQIFPTKEITIESNQILKASDILMEVLDDLDNLRNLIEVMQLGFGSLTCKERISEISSLQIISQQLYMLEESKVTVVSTLLTSILKGNDA